MTPAQYEREFTAVGNSVSESVRHQVAWARRPEYV